MGADVERHRAQAVSYIQIAKLMTNETTVAANALPRRVTLHKASIAGMTKPRPSHLK
jgi:hypothetical protein